MVLRPYCFIIDILSKATGKISPRVRSVSFNAVIFLLIGTMTVYHCNQRIINILHFHDYWYPLCVTLFVMLLLVSIDRKTDISSLKPSGIFWTGWFVCFIMSIAADIMHPSGVMDFLWMWLCVTITPCLMIVWSEPERIRYFCDTVARDMVICSYFFIILCFAVTPFTERSQVPEPNEYMGIVGHPNSNGTLCIGFVLAAVYMLVTAKKHRLIYVIALGLSIAPIHGANCRSAMLGLILSLTAAVIYMLIHKGAPDLRVVRKAVIYLLIIAAVAYSSEQALLYLDHMDLNGKAVAEEPAAAPAADDDSVSEDPQVEEENSLYTIINRISSDRLNIWKDYVEKITLWGNGARPVRSVSAHNNVLEIAYTSGLIAALGFVIWVLYVLFFIVKSIFVRSRFDPVVLMLIMTFLSYFTIMLLEVMQYHYKEPEVFMAYILLSLPALRRSAAEEDAGEAE